MSTLDPTVQVRVRSSPLFLLAVTSMPPVEEVYLFAFRSSSPGGDFDLPACVSTSFRKLTADPLGK